MVSTSMSEHCYSAFFCCITDHPTPNTPNKDHFLVFMGSVTPESGRSISGVDGCLCTMMVGAAARRAQRRGRDPDTGPSQGALQTRLMACAVCHLDPQSGVVASCMVVPSSATSILRSPWKPLHLVGLTNNPVASLPLGCEPSSWM